MSGPSAFPTGKEGVWGMQDQDEVRRVSARVSRIVGANSGLRGDADDACQAAWLEFLSRPPVLRDPGALAGWLTTVARRYALRAVETRSRTILVDDSRLESESPVDPPEGSVLAGELGAALWRAVDNFPDRHRRLMLLVAHCPELRHTELAAELGISPASVPRIKQRCLDALRRRLEAEGFSYP